MSSKSLETVLRELQKSMQILVNKVRDLETQIIKQNDVIAKLSEYKTQSKITTTRKSLCGALETGSTGTTTTTERPKRQAAVNASAALSAGASKKRMVGKRPDEPTTGKKITESCVNETTTSTTSEASCSTMTKPPTVSSTKGAATLLASNLVPNIIPMTYESNVQLIDESNDFNDWREVSTKKRRRNQRKVVEGAGSENNELKTVEKLQFIQAWSFRPETTTENITNHLNMIHKSNDYTVKKRDIKTTRHAAFVIGIPESLFDTISQPSVWPAGVRFAEWFLMRPRQ